MRDEHRLAGDEIRGGARPGVEPEPSDPQEARSDVGQHERVRGFGYQRVAGSFTDHRRHSQAGNAGAHVHDDAAREVDGSEGVEERAVPAPHLRVGFRVQVCQRDEETR